MNFSTRILSSIPFSLDFRARILFSIFYESLKLVDKYSSRIMNYSLSNWLAITNNLGINKLFRRMFLSDQFLFSFHVSMTIA